MSFSLKGGGLAQREQPWLQQNSVQPTWKIRSSVGALEPWARSAAPSAHRPGRGAAFLQTGALLLTPSVLSLSYCEAADPLGPKSDFMENTFQITSLISSMTINIVSCVWSVLFFPTLKIIFKDAGERKKKLFIYLVSLLSFSFSRQWLAAGY